MANEWRSYPLGLLTKWSSGGTPSKSKEEYWNGEIPWISASSMDGSRYSNSKLKITRAGLDNGSRLAKKGSVLLLVRGSILHQKIQVGIAEKDVAFNQDVKCLVANDKYIDQWFLLYWFKAHERKLLSIVENTGIGAGKLDTKILQKLDVKVPPDEIRYKIVSFVKSLDDKIELNKKINQTLEQMAQALFKSWFVDFDPVFDNLLDKHNNNLEKAKAYLESKGAEDLCPKLTKRYEQRQQIKDQKPLPQDTRNLFPSDFHHDQDLGWIPEGWGADKLGNYISVKRGGSPRPIKDYISDKGFPWTKISDATSSSFRFISKIKERIKPEGLSKTTLLKRGTLILSNSATPGLPKFLDLDACIHDGWLHFPSKKVFSDLYLYQLFLVIRKQLVQQGNGSVFTNLKTDILKNHRLVIPSKSVLDLFDDKNLHVHDKLLKLMCNTEKLEVLKNTLLPNLINGTIKLGD